MSPKVLRMPEAELSPAPWRICSAAAPVPGACAMPEDELMALRTRIAELEAASEVKARRAYESGLREGEEAARRKLDAENRELLTRLAASAAQIGEARADAIRRAEGDVVRLAVQIARRALHRELESNPAVLDGLVHAALEKLRSEEIHRLRVHPSHQETARKSLDETARGASIEIVADPSLPLGGAVFEIARGALDASIESQLAEIERGVMDQIEVDS